MPEFDPTRYACQARLPAWDGPRGQAKLAAATAVVVGVGATGSVIAEALVRAGVGHVRLIDRDVLELSNLQRQSLYDEDDLASGLPKAEAARRRLSRINSEVSLDARVSDLTARNAGELLEGADVVLDGTDNFVTRFVINDACARAGVPWVYAGVVGTTVHGFPIVPGGACFRCYLPSPPPPGTTETCQTAGVIGPAVQIAGGLAATEGLKLLLGLVDEVASGLFVMDVWTRDARRVGLQRDPSCATCAGQYPALEADEAGGHAELCGQDAVALRSRGASLDLVSLASRLDPLGTLEVKNRFLLRFTPAETPGLMMTVFADGRALVKGTTDPAAARGVYAKYVGT